MLVIIVIIRVRLVIDWLVGLVVLVLTYDCHCNFIYFYVNYVLSYCMMLSIGLAYCIR